MSKMHKFSNKFSKIALAFNLQYWWPGVTWFGQIVVLKLIITKLNLKNSVMTAF